MTFRLRPMGGLCNRLRAIFSYRAVYKTLLVEWGSDPQDQAGAGEFLDVFMPLRGVKFVPLSSTWQVAHQGEALQVGEALLDNDPHREAPIGWQDAYRELELQPRWKKKLPESPYDAMHVRRTDLIPLLKREGVQIAEDDAFLAWARRGGVWPVWVATDNGATQRELRTGLSAIGRTMLVYEEIVEQNIDGIRNTDLASSAVDLFACAGGLKFLGTYGSSFTAAIELLRRLV
jgi:hypothetical protein